MAHTTEITSGGVTFEVSELDHTAQEVDDACAKLETSLAIANGGTGATTVAAALTNLGALPLSGGTMTGEIKFFSDDVSVNSIGKGTAMSLYAGRAELRINPTYLTDANDVRSCVYIRDRGSGIEWPLATATTLTPTSLPLVSGATTTGVASSYYKTQEGIVLVNINEVQFSATNSEFIFANLPSGYRGNAFGVGYVLNAAGNRGVAKLRTWSDGSIRMQDASISDVTIVKGILVFVAVA